MLDTKDVAEMFKRCNLAVYAEARRIYYREVNLNPCKKYPKQVLQRSNGGSGIGLPMTAPSAVLD